MQRHFLAAELHLVIPTMVVLDVTRPKGAEAWTHLVTSQYSNLNTPGVQGEQACTWVVPEGFEHWIVRHCDDLISSVSVTSPLIPL
jgi:hypothetical protein